MPPAGRYAAEGLFVVIAAHKADATQPTILHRRDLSLQLPRSGPGVAPYRPNYEAKQ